MAIWGRVGQNEMKYIFKVKYFHMGNVTQVSDVFEKQPPKIIHVCVN
jgi:hypothetical protein